MKRVALLVALSMLALSVLTHCSKEKPGEASAGVPLAPARPQAAKAAHEVNAPAMLKLAMQSPDNSHSQASESKGGKLEAIDYFEAPTAGEEAQLQFGGYLIQSDERLPPQATTVTIRKAGFDTTNPVDPSVPLYEVQAHNENLCAGQAYAETAEERARLSASGTLSKLKELEGKAIRVPGYWKDGRWQETGPDGKPVFTLSCITGAIAKCVHWGYVPGFRHASGRDLGAHHRACVQAARAMYLRGKELSFTCRRTDFDIYDSLNINRKEIASFQFESLWNEEGLVCMARSRWGKCHGTLASGGVSEDPQQCKDPVSGVGQDWPRDTSAGNALIAISSAPGKDVGVCPAELKPGVKCPGDS